MSIRPWHRPDRLSPNIVSVMEASNLSNHTISRALNALGASTVPSTLSRWRRGITRPDDLRPFAAWSGISELTLAYATATAIDAAIATAKAGGRMVAAQAEGRAAAL